MKTRKTTPPTPEDIPFVVSEPTVAYKTSSKYETSAWALLGIESELPALSIAENAVDIIGYIREGVPKKALDHFAQLTNLSAAEVASIIHTSERTLRRYKPAQKLNTEQSERVIELARLYARGAGVFDDLDQFKIWMTSPVEALGNQKPQSFLDTSMGIQMLTEELGRIEHGIFA